MSPFVIVVVALFIPIVAIVGGITAAIFRTHGQARIAELAMKERIAAIEKGIDPSTLPPAPSLASFENRESVRDPREQAEETAQGLLIGGVVTVAAGLGVGLLLWLLPAAASLNLWSIGLVPGLVGVGLLIASFLVRPRPAT
jgi:hypothetical protein